MSKTFDKADQAMSKTFDRPNPQTVVIMEKKGDRDKMELGRQIKRYRNEAGISQDELAEKVYVSRQTISNWENDKNYPDINSLLRLSEIFHVSIDILIKGDVEEMKEAIRGEDVQRFKKMSNIFAVLFFAMILTPVPLLHYLDLVGIGIWVVLAAVTLWAGSKVEKEKKAFDVQTYKEIVAFMDGNGMDQISKAREEGKRPYQKVLLAVAFGLLALAFDVWMLWLLG